MNKLNVLILGLFVFLVHILHLQARDDEDKYSAFLSAWPTHQGNPVACFQTNFYSNQSQLQQDPYNFNTPQNSEFTFSSAGQDWYQQHRQFVLNRIVGVALQGKMIRITPEDIALINRICADNLHKNQDELRKQLAASSAFNYAQHFLKGHNLLDAFTSDIYINPAHFKQVSASDYRVKRLMDAAKDAIEDRYEIEKSKLKTNSKITSKNRKKLKTDLDARHKYEKKHPLGVKQLRKPIVAASQSQAVQQVRPQQVTKTSTIASQEIQKLTERNNNQVLRRKRNAEDRSNSEMRSTVSESQDSSFQQVMNQRSKAFESSISNSISTTDHIKINSQTAGFLQAQGVDITPFQQIEGLPIQHQLTHELVDVLDVVADYAQQYHYEIYQTHLTKYCAHLASLSQQSNVEGALEQAIDGTNCCHGIQHYLEGMVSGVAQAYQQFQTALDYFEAVADTYGNLIVQHGAQGAVIAHGLEAIVTAGMIAAPTVTIAATGVMIGATAYVMAPVCFQALMELKGFGSACIVGNWDKVGTDLDNFGEFISSRETVARMVELAGGAAMPTPNLSSIVDQVLSLRPVITSVQNASGKAIESFYFMTKSQAQKVYTQAIELMQTSELANFNLSYKRAWGSDFFKLVEQNNPALVPAIAGLEAELISSADQATLTQLFSKSEGLVAVQVVKSSSGYVISNKLLESNYAFSKTELGQNMLDSVTKNYEEIMFVNIAKEYEKLIDHQAPQEVVDSFCRCQELSIVPDDIKQDFLNLHVIFENKYFGLPEFSSKNQYLTMQMRHIFYPSLQPKLNVDCLSVKKYILNGFHHDEYAVLENTAKVAWKNKIYGKAKFGADEFFMADSDWGNGIICEVKTFFPSNWSKEKVAQVIFEAAQNRIEDLTKPSDPFKKFLCQGQNNIFIEIVINSSNVITSAYPSLKNFIGV